MYDKKRNKVRGQTRIIMAKHNGRMHLQIAHHKHFMMSCSATSPPDLHANDG